VRAVLLDTGPLVAYLKADEEHHSWAVRQFAALTTPVLTCEAVWAEAAYLLRQRGGSPDALWTVLRNGAALFAFKLDEDYESVATLMRRYADVPMSLADACLVRMSELHPDCHVFTTDSHFRFYRRFGRQVVPLIAPA
jgi:predicted nucleic acid-binding protein